MKKDTHTKALIYAVGIFGIIGLINYFLYAGSMNYTYILAFALLEGGLVLAIKKESITIDIILVLLAIVFYLGIKPTYSVNRAGMIISDGTGLEAIFQKDISYESNRDKSLGFGQYIFKDLEGNYYVFDPNRGTYVKHDDLGK